MYIIRIQDTYIIVFKSPNQSILLLKLLRKKGYTVRVITAPCVLSKGCARAIKFNYSDLDSIKNEIKSNNISILGIYKKTFNKCKAHYDKLL